jgi:hypothetical protein
MKYLSIGGLYLWRYEVGEEKMVERIIRQEKATECAFHKKDREVCSGPEIIEKLGEFVENDGVENVRKGGAKKVVKHAKEILGCDTESCVVKHPVFLSFARIPNLERLLSDNFKPDGPSETENLLSNFNIDDVLRQFEKKYKHRRFLHIPFQMRDFEKVGTSLATTDLAKEFLTHDTFGVVFNTDWSTGNGIHWFCLFGEREKSTGNIVLEYFNSSGKTPLPEIQAWLHKTKHYLEKELGVDVKVIYNTGIRFQDDEHSCGVYSLCYIWMRLEGVQAKDIKKSEFNDELMLEARNALFRDDGRK